MHIFVVLRTNEIKDELQTVEILLDLPKDLQFCSAHLVNTNTLSPVPTA